MEKTLQEFCRSEVAHFKVPKYFIFKEELPMTVSGKIQKFIMREESIDILKLKRVQQFQKGSSSN